MLRGSAPQWSSKIDMTYAAETRELTRIFTRKPKWHIFRRKKENEMDENSVEPVMALDKVNVTIDEGELFGILGPNGAGKTTLIKVLCTLLLPTSGSAYVSGYDVAKDVFQIRRKINMVSGGETSGYGLLTTRENIWMFSQFYGIPSKTSKERIDELLHTFDLWDKRNAKVRTLSTGERQKMNMIRGFVTDPEILFLDEPTLGLDVNASRTIREYVMNWVKNNDHKTVFLTTHYMMEADMMCDRVAIIDRGRILALDTPERLKKTIRKDAVVQLDVDMLKDKSSFSTIKGVKNFSYKDDIARGITSLTFIISDESAISDVLSILTSEKSRIRSMHKSEPTLEDVFISMVGKGLE